MFLTICRYFGVGKRIDFSRIPEGVLAEIIARNYALSLKCRAVCKEWRDEVGIVSGKFENAAVRIQRFYRRKRGLENLESVEWLMERQPLPTPNTKFNKRLTLRMYDRFYENDYYRKWPLAAMGISDFSNSPRWTWSEEIVEAWEEYKKMPLEKRRSRKTVQWFMKKFEPDWILQIGW